MLLLSMIQRRRDALRRGTSAEQPYRQYRPNELRLDVVRAERLRRDARRSEPVVGPSGRSLEELRERRPPEPLPAPAARSLPARQLFAALKTRSGVRQAWLLKEILSPPLALRDRHDDHDR
jgi:hypothetical protein